MVTLGFTVAAIVVAVQTPAQAFPSYYYIIRNELNGKCLDADATNGSNGTKVQLWDCHGGKNQRWYTWSNMRTGIAELRNGRFGNMCLDSDNSRPINNGLKVQLWTCHGGNNQRWMARNAEGPSENDMIYHSSASYPFILDADISGGSVNGMKVQLWGDLKAANQHWILQYNYDPNSA
ncbi:RICIN domain-containing protein [Micromonospora echinaurantiaca]|uniref:RICIN domain-containing protein n=1 Tax=Micromonospora echinaurantiaca TaxID=47857 RepID=UPI000B5AC71D